MLLTLSKEYSIDLNKPFIELSEREKNIILYGIEKPLKMYTINDDRKVFYEKSFSGVVGFLQEKLRSETRSDSRICKKLYGLSSL